jgi:hypothetical protein
MWTSCILGVCQSGFCFLFFDACWEVITNVGQIPHFKVKSRIPIKHILWKKCIEKFQQYYLLRWIYFKFNFVPLLDMNLSILKFKLIVNTIQSLCIYIQNLDHHNFFPFTWEHTHIPKTKIICKRVEPQFLK